MSLQTEKCLHGDVHRAIEKLPHDELLCRCCYIFLLNRATVRRTARLAAATKPAFPTIKMTVCNASVNMDIQENLVVSLKCLPHKYSDGI